MLFKGYGAKVGLGNMRVKAENRMVTYFERRSTNAASESFNAKIKNFRSLFRGVKDRAFFLFRLSKIYA